MPKATWNGAVLAESNDTVVVERNHYFPRESLRDEIQHAALTDALLWFDRAFAGDADEAPTWAAFDLLAPHARAVAAVREGQWFREELYARFRILALVEYLATIQEQ